jgi:hypothetical protein
MSDQPSSPDVVALRPFVPSMDFETSLRFYVDLGFTAHRFDKGLAAIELGPFGFCFRTTMLKPSPGIS